MSSLETNAMSLSSVVDGVILLQYIERNQRVEKLLNVLKMRGCNHSKDIFRYTIETGGLKIGQRYGAPEPKIAEFERFDDLFGFLFIRLETIIIKHYSMCMSPYNSLTIYLFFPQLFFKNKHCIQ